MATFKNIISTTADSISSGGTVTGDLTVEGDLLVEGDGALSLDLAVTGDDITFSSTTSNKPVLTLKNDNDDDSPSILSFFKDNTGSALDQDNIGQIFWKAYNDAGTPELTTYADMYVLSTDVSNGTEDASIVLRVMSAGTLTKSLVLDANSRMSLSNNDSNTENTVFGYKAFTNNGTVLSNVGADYNTAIGHYAMGTGTTTDAINNTGVGNRALEDITSGDGNVGVGSYACSSITTGTANVAIGGSDGTTAGAMRLATTVQRCVAIGTGAGAGALVGDGTTDETTADGLIAIGYKAGAAITSGVGNVAIGYQALKTSSANGDGNTAVGYKALEDMDADVDGHGYNTAIGYIACLNLSTGAGNTAIGAGALGTAAIAGDNNIAVGNNTGRSITSGTDNVIVGKGAGEQLTTAQRTVIIGSLAGDAAMVTGGSVPSNADGTVAIGYSALGSLTSGGGNIAMGYYALASATTSAKNVAIGYQACEDMGLGENGNVAIGYAAMDSVAEHADGGSTADGNIAIGKDSLKGGALADGGVFSHNIAIGKDALTSTSSNPQTGTIAIGGSALAALTSGAKNTAIGYQAGLAMTDNGSNVVIGYQSFIAADAGESHNIVIGEAAGSDINHADSDDNIIIGKDAGQGGAAAMASCIVIGKDAMNSTASNAQTGTVAIGTSALTALTSGASNTAVGYQALKTEDANSENTAIGFEALMVNNGADGNTALGYRAGYDVTTGGGNALIGAEAGANVVGGADNVMVGKGAGAATTAGLNMVLIGRSAGGSGNITTNATGTVAIGHSALAALTSGAANTAIGYAALDAITTSSNNTAIGFNALGACGDSYSNVAIGLDAGDTITNGGGLNTVIGTSADVSTAAAENQIVIGNGTTGVANNSVTLGNASVTAVYMSSDSQALVHSAGIQFAATQVANAGANVFDDYEEGTWTPMITDGSNNATMHGNNGGYYTKIGRTVHVTAYITSSSLGSVSGNTSLSGLPFTCANANGAYSGIAIVGNGGLAITAGESLGGYVAKNTTTVALLVTDHVVGATNLQHDEWTDDGEAMFQATYMI